MQSYHLTDEFTDIVAEQALLVLQRDFVTSHPGVPGRAGDGTDTRRGSVPGYTGPAPMPPGA